MSGLHVEPGATLDSPHVRAALSLADAWWPSHRAMWNLGYGTGYREGWLAGRNEESDAWQKIMGVYREAVFLPNTRTSRPTHAELVERRQAAPRCATACQQCSACTRLAVVARNQARYGSDDYPGEVAA